jgi:hypothetical protein
MLMTVIYLSLAAAMLGLVVWCLFREKDPARQITAAMVALPLLLRVLLIK